MADNNYGVLTIWGWEPHTPCYVAALHTTNRTPSPDLSPDELDVENEYDPAFRSLREQSQSLKISFQKCLNEYDQLKYELRRVTIIYDHVHRGDPNSPSSTLADQDILEVDGNTLRRVQSRLYYEKLEQEQFFVLFEASDVLLDKLRVLHYAVDEARHIARRDKLVHVQMNLDFVIKELHGEISALLSSRSAINYSS
ncbi:unnamed protein product, partial [Aureobasidium mustum]